MHDCGIIEGCFRSKHITNSFSGMPQKIILKKNARTFQIFFSKFQKYYLFKVSVPFKAVLPIGTAVFNSIKVHKSHHKWFHLL